MVGMKSGRTIGEKRERLETASERASIKKKAKKRRFLRIFSTTLGFVVIAICAAMLFFWIFRGDDNPGMSYRPTIVVPYAPTVEVIDEDAGSEAELSSSMKEYIGQAEADFRELGYISTKVVRPVGSIRELDFYLEGYAGFIKLTTDRGTGVSVEDADRMIRYLTGQGITDFQYIDVRLSGQAYWK